MRHPHLGSLGQPGASPGYLGTFRQLERAGEVAVVAYCETAEPELLERGRAATPEARLYTDLDELLERERFEVAVGDIFSVELRLVTTQLGPLGRDPTGWPYRPEIEGGGIVHWLGCHYFD